MTTAADVAKILDAKKSGYGYLAKCPAHPDNHPSLWFSDTVCSENPEGKLRFTCFVGCHYSAVRAALDIDRRGKTSTPEIRHIKTGTNKPDAFGEMVRRNKSKKAQEKLLKVWDNAKPIVPNSIGWNYLVLFRKVLRPDEPVPAIMRETVLKYYDQDGNYVNDFAAIVTRLDHLDGTLATIHRTYLRPDGMGKAPVVPAKKLMSAPNGTNGAAIHLYEPQVFEGNVVLGIAEGIETALAARILSGCPVWAAWSSSGLAKVNLPNNITHLIIFQDNDKAGRKAASDLKRRLLQERPEIKTLIKAPVHSNDWADVLSRQPEAI